MLYDFASAFPSMAHAWLLSGLEAIEIWESFLTGIANLYKGNGAHAVSEGPMQHLFPILSVFL